MGQATSPAVAWNETALVSYAIDLWASYAMPGTKRGYGLPDLRNGAVVLDRRRSLCSTEVGATTLRNQISIHHLPGTTCAEQRFVAFDLTAMPGADICRDIASLDGTTVLYLGAVSENLVILTESWDDRSDSNRDGPASGETELVFEGHGFGGAYRCSFGGAMTSNASAVNSKTITCVTPAWGSLYSSASVSVNIERSDGGGGWAVVPFLNGGMAPISTSSG